MKKTLQTHIDWILTVVGILIVATVGWFLVWGVTTLAESLGMSLGNPQTPNSEQKFDLAGASQLNFHGLNGQ